MTKSLLPNMQSRMWVSVAKTWLRQTTGKMPEIWLIGDTWALELEGYPEEQYMTIDVYSLNDILTVTVEYR